VTITKEAEKKPVFMNDANADCTGDPEMRIDSTMFKIISELSISDR
jgi:hypothetical protein